jgi:DNA mismatch repair protein MutL
MNKIHIMDEVLANKIAAGEVVEKLVSVVKELVENSIDAGSTEIAIDLASSGMKMIRVIDNGSGMSKSDAEIAFFRHATSKILTDDDLFNINTLGFRGEALASIASISKLELITNNCDEITKVLINGGKIESITTGACNKGTMITVSDIFYNTPARLKHIKNLYQELSYIVSFIENIALSYPNISFKLTNDDKVLIKTSGNGELLGVIRNIYGTSIYNSMLYIEGETDDYKVSGYVSKPSVNKTNNSSITTIVNGRVIKNNNLNRIINNAYHTYKPDNRYPYVLININVDPELIDVNIHPTKMDIKFSKMEDLNNLIEELIKEAISEKVNIINIESNKEDIISEIEDSNNEEIEDKEEYVETTLFDLEVKEEGEKYFPILEVAGLVHGTYIVAQNEEGMYLIDVHAAKERINYEIVKKSFGNVEVKKTKLLVPVLKEFKKSDYIIFNENIELFKSLGFEYKEMGINTISVDTVPAWLPDIEGSVNTIIEYIIALERNFDLERFRESLAILVSCKMSIKANTYSSISEMESLLNDLKNCDNPYNCPHGRPTIIKYSISELESNFKRSGF